MSKILELKTQKDFQSRPIWYHGCDNSKQNAFAKPKNSNTKTQTHAIELYSFIYERSPDQEELHAVVTKQLQQSIQQLNLPLQVSSWHILPGFEQEN